MKRTKLPGIYKRLNELDPHDLLTYDGMREIFDCGSDDAINDAVDRGELPPPIKFFGNHMWLASMVIQHIQWQAQSVRTERMDAQGKVKQLYPGMS